MQITKEKYNKILISLIITITLTFESQLTFLVETKIPLFNIFDKINKLLSKN